jgi:heme exporter protein CcmD
VIGMSASAMLMAMDDAGFIVGSYVITLAVVGGLALAIVRRGRRLADRVDDADKYWI